MECLKDKPRYVVFHPGKPHADDMFAAGVYTFFFGDVTFVRRNPTKQELNDPTIHICDTGGSYDKERNNYDHHHEKKTLPASCVLVWNAFMPEYTEELRLIKTLVYTQLLSAVDNGDRGIFSDGLVDGSFLRNYANSFSSHDEAFAEGAELCHRIILGKVAAILKVQKLKHHWESFKTFGNGKIVFINDALDFVPADFKEVAQQKGIQYLVLREHKRDMAARLYSLGSEIPSDPKRQQELFTDKKNATYRSVDSAINHALELVLARSA